jgi:hypothetical protein
MIYLDPATFANSPHPYVSYTSEISQIPKLEMRYNVLSNCADIKDIFHLSVGDVGSCRYLRDKMR